MFYVTIIIFPVFASRIKITPNSITILLSWFNIITRDIVFSICGNSILENITWRIVIYRLKVDGHSFFSFRNWGFVFYIFPRQGMNEIIFVASLLDNPDGVFVTIGLIGCQKRFLWITIGGTVIGRIICIYKMGLFRVLSRNQVPSLLWSQFIIPIIRTIVISIPYFIGNIIHSRIIRLSPNTCCAQG